MAEMTTIARPYAEAIFGRAVDSAQMVQWSDQLALLANLVNDEKVSEAMGNPRYTRDQKVGFMVTLCGDALNGEGKNLLKVMAENKRLSVLPMVAQQFEMLRHEREGILDATVVSAFSMDTAQIATLTQQLTKRFGQQVRVQVTVDAELLGGFSVSVGDTVIDGSVRARLQQMATALKQ